MKMEKEEFFKVGLIKQNEEKETVFYRKEKEKFIGDYAIVKAFSKDPKYANQVWNGIINRNFEIVWNFELGTKIERFPENHFLIYNHDYCRNVRLAKINDQDGARVLGVVGSYKKRVDENVIVVASNIFSDYNYIALYDVLKNKIISNWFTEIGEFQKVDGKEVALARRRLNPPENANLLYPLDVMCYIDKEGEICSLVYNPITQDYEKVLSNDFGIFISDLEAKILIYEPSEEVEQHLKRKLIK